MADKETLYALLPEHHVYLCSDRDDGRYLAESFVAAWSRIPADQTQMIIEHWNQRQDQANPDPLLVVHLVDKCGSEPSTGAQVLDQGHRIHFKRDWYGLVPWAVPDSIIPIVAHELAHVALIAAGEPNHIANLGNDEPCANDEEIRINDNGERLANDLAESWGFERRDKGARYRRA